MPKKPDLTAVKHFLFNYGEKLALGTCVLVAVLLLSVGLLGSRGAGNSPGGTAWAPAIKAEVSTIRGRIASAEPVEMDAKTKEQLLPEHYIWRVVQSFFNPGPFISIAETGDTKRRNPTILPLKAEDGTIQLDALRGLYFRYDADPVGKKVWVFKDGATAGPGVKGPMGGENAGMAGQGAAAGTIVKDARAKRLVLAHLIFPMKDQVELYRKAFRLNNQAELFAQRDSLPRPIGLNVVRYEILPGGAYRKNPDYLYIPDPKKDGVKVAKKNDDVLRDAQFDEEQNALYENYLFQGLAMPLPLLANAKYPKLTLPGIVANVGNAPDPKNPKGDGPAMPIAPKGPGVQLPGFNKPGMNPMGGVQPNNAPVQRDMKMESWTLLGKKDVNLKALVERFDGKYDPFHPLGTILKDDKKAANQAAPGMPNGAMASGAGAPGGLQNNAARSFNPFDLQAGGIPGGAGGPGVMPMSFPMGKDGENPAAAPNAVGGNVEWLTDALVRFIDLDVEPGKTYRYHVQVRMANPNYGRKVEVAFIALAEVKELLSPWILTPEVTIPGEYYYYAVDQTPLDAANGVKFDKNLLKPDPTRAPLQIHRWFEQAPKNAGNEPIGDWGIAERQMLRKGEYIGGPDLLTEVPLWDKAAGTFVTRTSRVVDKKRSQDKNGVPLDYVVSYPAPLLVDFQGGKKPNARVGPVAVNDESAVDALILRPDGKLIVRNTRFDADPAVESAKERQERVEAVRERVQEVHNGAAAGGAAQPPGGPANLPGFRPAN